MQNKKAFGMQRLPLIKNVFRIYDQRRLLCHSVFVKAFKAFSSHEKQTLL